MLFRSHDRSHDSHDGGREDYENPRGDSSAQPEPESEDQGCQPHSNWQIPFPKRRNGRWLSCSTGRIVEHPLMENQWPPSSVDLEVPQIAHQLNGKERCFVGIEW